MIHIRHMCRISLQSSPLHYQPLQKLGLLHSTLQQNNCTRSSFFITVWPWERDRVIQTAIKLKSLVMPSVIPCLKDIGSEVSGRRPTVKAYSTKSTLWSSFPWISIVWNKYSKGFNKSTGCGSIPHFIQVDWELGGKTSAEIFDFS